LREDTILERARAAGQRSRCSNAFPAGLVSPPRRSPRSATTRRGCVGGDVSRLQSWLNVSSTRRPGSWSARTPGVGDFVGAHGTTSQDDRGRGQPECSARRRAKATEGCPRFRIDVERATGVKIRTWPVRNFRGTVRGVIEARGLVRSCLIIFNRPPGDPRILHVGGSNNKRRAGADVLPMRVRKGRRQPWPGRDGESQAPVPRRAGDAVPPRRTALGSTGSNIGQLDAVHERTKGVERDDNTPFEITRSTPTDRSSSSPRSPAAVC